MNIVIKNYKLFLESYMSSEKEYDVKDIISYINNNTELKLQPYFELFNLQRKNNFLSGKLFISLNTNKAIRINWIKNDIANNIDSIDVWENFDFKTNPNHTLIFKKWSSELLKEILIFINNPTEYNNINKISANNNINIIKTNYRSEKDSDNTTQLELNMSIYNDINTYIDKVINENDYNSIIITGESGIGKTDAVLETIKRIGKDYYYNNDVKSENDLIEIIHKNSNKLLIIDNTKEELSSLIEKVLQKNEIIYNGEKINFTGKLIIIANSDYTNTSKFSFHIMLEIDKTDLIYNMKNILGNICTDVSMDEKEIVLDFIHNLSDTYPDKYDLSVKNLINSINLKIDNENWKLLIKKYIID
jgi:hypothetical protein